MIKVVIYHLIDLNYLKKNIHSIPTFSCSDLKLPFTSAESTKPQCREIQCVQTEQCIQTVQKTPQRTRLKPQLCDHSFISMTIWEGVWRLANLVREGSVRLLTVTFFCLNLARRSHSNTCCTQWAPSVMVSCVMDSEVSVNQDRIHIYFCIFFLSQ